MQVLRMVMRGQSDELRRALHFAVTGAVLRAPPARAFAAAIDAANEVGVFILCHGCCPNVRNHQNTLVEVMSLLGGNCDERCIALLQPTSMQLGRGCTACVFKPGCSQNCRT